MSAETATHRLSWRPGATPEPFSHPATAVQTTASVGEETGSRRSRLSPAKSFLRNPSGMTGLAILLTIGCMAILAPVFYSEGPLEMVSMPLVWPFEDWSYPLGTDALGRDVAASVAWGSRVTILV